MEEEGGGWGVNWTFSKHHGKISKFGRIVDQKNSTVCRKWITQHLKTAKGVSQRNLACNQRVSKAISSFFPDVSLLGSRKLSFIRHFLKPTRAQSNKISNGFKDL